MQKQEGNQNPEIQNGELISHQKQCRDKAFYTGTFIYFLREFS